VGEVPDVVRDAAAGEGHGHCSIEREIVGLVQQEHEARQLQDIKGERCKGGRHHALVSLQHPAHIPSGEKEGHALNG
jgi:hypothetical protein